MDYSDFFRKWDKIFINPAVTAFQKNAQKISQITSSPAFANIDNIQKNAQKLSQIVNSPASKIITEQCTLWDSALHFNNALKIADIANLQNHVLYQTPFTNNQLIKIKNILEPSKSLFSAIKNNNSIFNAFNNTGIFPNISNISKNMSAIAAINKLNKLSSLLELSEYTLKFSKNNDIIIDDEKLSDEDILEFTKEFKELPIDNSNSQIVIKKLKSKKGFFFLHILWFILFNLFFSPLVDDFFTALRDKTGISTILEKIDIKAWIDELWENKSNDNTLDNPSTTDQTSIE